VTGGSSDILGNNIEQRFADIKCIHYTGSYSDLKKFGKEFCGEPYRTQTFSEFRANQRTSVELRLK